ncbi:MAG: GGDEF domain-containing protein [Nitrospiraceae bacterium]|nr:MAG: GGDEF domain-containing protein [Nitrospiraceae bacterium]
MTIYLQSSFNTEGPQKRFNLRKYFSHFSIGIIIVLTVILSALVYWNQRETLIEYSISSAKDFARQLNNRIHDDFIEANLQRYSYLRIDPSSEQYLQLDKIAETFLHDYSDIKKVKIFNLQGEVIYSTDPKDIGLTSEAEALKRSLTGLVFSELTRKGSQFSGKSDNRGMQSTFDIIEVYTPIYKNITNASPDEVVGAFEIYKDVSPIFNLMRAEFYKVPLLLILSMGVLYLFLQIIIRNANSIINRQHDEIDMHRAELEEAQKRIKKAIDQVIEHESFHVRLQCDNLLKCWEVKNCDQQGCPSYKSENLRCWQVSGTFCGGNVQGFFAQKFGDCRKCEIYQNAFKDRISLIGESFNNMMVLLETKHQQLKKLNEKLNVLIDTDPLTEVGNRRSFQKRMDSVHLLSLRYNHPYSIVICDVDMFKSYNDTYGHQKGDYALVSIANAMKASIRRTDEIFRWGGEEFILILPEQNLTTALKVAETLRGTVESLAIPHAGSPSKMLTLSLGVACNIAENVKYISWESVIKQADDELYRAKAAGKNCVYPVAGIQNAADNKR